VTLLTCIGRGGTVQGEVECSYDMLCHLAALALQAVYGDFTWSVVLT